MRHEAAAKSGGEAAIKAAKEAGIDPTFVILTGVQGDPTHDARMNGFKEGAEGAGGQFLETQYCDAIADRERIRKRRLHKNHLLRI